VCIPGRVAAQYLDPGQLVLSLDDLPRGFATKVGSDRYLTNADAAGDDQTLVELEQYGRQLGYIAAFVRASAEPGEAVSIIQVESNASVYATAEGARGVFELRAQSPPEGWTALPIPQLADDATGVVRQLEIGGDTYDVRAIILRKGRIVSRLDTVSLPGTGDQETIELAEVAAVKLQ